MNNKTNDIHNVSKILCKFSNFSTDVCPHCDIIDNQRICNMWGTFTIEAWAVVNYFERKGDIEYETR